MKKIYRRHMLHTVRQTFSRFIAIFAIVALGVGFLAGLLSTTPDIRYSGDLYFDDTRLFDLRVAGSMGLSDANVSAIRAVEGVEDVMPAYAADVLTVTPDGDTAVTRLHSLPFDKADDPEARGYLNRISLVDGRLPEKANECVVQQSGQFSGKALRLGDQISVSPDNKDLTDTLAVTQYTIVGLAESSYYCSIERESASVGSGTLGLILYVREDAFSLPVYSTVYLTVKGAAAKNSLQDAYTDLIDPVEQRLEDIGDAQSALRLSEVKADAQEKLDDAKQEYADAKAEAAEKLGDAADELEEAARKLADGRSQIRENEQKLADAKTQIDSGQSELDAGRQSYAEQMAAGRAKLADAEAQLNDGTAQYNAGLAQYNAGLAQYNTGLAQYNTGYAALQQAKDYVANNPAAVAYMESCMATIAQIYLGHSTYTLEEVDSLALTLPNNVSTASAAYQQAVDAVTDPPGSTLATDYANAQLALDTAMTAAGYTAESSWSASSDAANAAVYIGARDAAKAALDQADPSGSATVDGVIGTAKSSYLDAVKMLLWFQTIRQPATLNLTIAKNEPELAAAKQQLDAAKQQLDAAKQQLDTAAAQLAAAAQRIAEGRAALDSASVTALAKLDEAAALLADARTQYASGALRLADAKGDLADGEQKYADGQAEYEEAKAEATQKLADAQVEIDSAEADINALETPDWYVLTRDSNTGFSSFKGNAQKVEAIAKIFPVFFFLVAALVALTTMTRMVEEERLQIGTLKALGYSKASIMAKYVLYALCASAAGSAFGALVGIHLFPTVIWNAYTMMYTLPHFYCLFQRSYVFGSGAAAIFCVLLATLNACWATLAECPAQLMLPRAPKVGKRILLEHITPLWKRLKFTYKVTARNLFRYKKRFFMTVTGIAGCTALLVTGFGLHDSINDIVNKQFGEIFTYDLTVAVKEAEDLTQGPVYDILNDTSAVESWMPVHMEHSTNSYNGKTFETYLFVPQQQNRLSEFVTLRERLSGKAIALAADGVVITEKMSERTGYGVGDEIPITNTDGRQGTFRITGVAENYVQNYVYLDAALYEQQFGAAPEFNLAVARAANTSVEARAALTGRLLDETQTASVSFTDDLKDTFSNMMAKIDTIVAVLILSAGLLAFVVLYNLTNINIAERSKEIATLKVLGFTDKEVAAYVYRESILLSLIGALFGLVLGVFLHKFVIYNVEVDAVMFGRVIKPLSYFYSAALTLVFSRLVDLVMRGRLRAISMVESMKAPE